MPKCDWCRAENANLRCSKCQACWFCDKKCAKRAWRTHKLYCTDDPVRKRHIAVEMAFERIVARKPRTEVPDDAVCYICLDGGDGLLRGCACRGPSAGFAHVDCLVEMAKRDPWILVEGRNMLNRWTMCGTCRQPFAGEVEAEMARRRWRLHRDDLTPFEKRHVCLSASVTLKWNDEPDASDLLYQAGKPCYARDDAVLLMAEIERAEADTNADAALERLTALGARCRHPPLLRGLHAHRMARRLGLLGRFQDALHFAAESIAISAAETGPESNVTLEGMVIYGLLLDDLGRVDEGIAMLTNVLATQTRVLGADHPGTHRTQRLMDTLSAAFDDLPAQFA
mmetsp:Transcript_26033/g.104162  ORF Transcript_26033/g.104162 Transcript_26033/m.104162 type:complete len:340 (-) Transcript_26033:258-1277(-)